MISMKIWTGCSLRLKQIIYSKVVEAIKKI